MTESAPQDENPFAEAMLPQNPRTIFLGGIFTILLLGALHLASEIAMPVALAFVLKLVLQPVMRLLERLRLPRSLAALLIIVGLAGTMAGFGTALSGPAAAWVERLPSSMPILQKRLGSITDSLGEAKHLMTQAEALTAGNERQPMPVAIQGNRLSDKMFIGTKAFIGGLFTTLLLLFFLLAAGDTFLRRLVEILPRFKDKRQAVELSLQIEQTISTYLLTITFMNILVGVATGLMMFMLGVSDPFLWGAIAFLLNYIPILGALMSAAIFLLAGLLSADSLSAAALPPLLYLIIHATESSIITPMLIARRFTLNPVLVTLSLIFWYWMWGFAGAILAMPMLAIAKIICDRVPKLAALGHFMEG